MVATQVADVFSLQSRFVRSVHLERDFPDPKAIEGYVVTPQAQQGIERVAKSLGPASTQRAWRITGDYGTGKSSFALALARLFSGRTDGLPASFVKAADLPGVSPSPPELFPILVTGARIPITAAIIRALHTAVESAAVRGKKPQLLHRLKGAAERPDAVPDRDVLTLLGETVQYVQETSKGSGVILVLDELGKFLEYAALHPERQDIYFLQALAEEAARSGKEALVVVGLLHQGFNAYAEQLSQTAQREWEKVAGRFEEIVFNQPLEQTARLVGDALNVRVKQLSTAVLAQAQKDMAKAVEVGWFGASANPEGLRDCAGRIYPLHPTVLPALVRIFTRFGQNERSLFTFLLSQEPFSLREFAERPLQKAGFYRIHNLYDYARSAFGSRLSIQSFRNHWNQIESVVESFSRDDPFELEILKTIAVLNLIDSPGLLATDDTVALAVDAGGKGTERVAAALRRLRCDRSILYYRGAAGGYCLWPHTSVDLERAYQEASKALARPDRVAPLIRDRLETRPLVARRHYIETGNLRHFSVAYVPPTELTTVPSDKSHSADGSIVVALCETEEDRHTALGLAKSPTFQNRPDILVAVPHPLQGLASLIQEVMRWEWITHNTPELNHDPFAMEEVSRQTKASQEQLRKRVSNYIGLRQFSETMDLDWFRAGKKLSVRSGRELLETISSVCDDHYPDAPRFKNELVNRHSLSSAAAAARQRLIEHVFQGASQPLLGMDAEAKPPEMSMYLSVMRAAGLHVRDGDEWAICLPPPKADPCNVRPILSYMLKLLEEQRESRGSVPEILKALRQPPYGLRDGMGPLLLAIFAVVHQKEVAIFEDGAFLSQLNGQEFQRLIKAPENFSVQYCRVAGVRTAVFEKLLRLLNPSQAKDRKADILDVVRPLCVLAAELPTYAQRTKTVSPEAARVREALLRAEEPATLIFRRLPEACGVSPFEGEEPERPRRAKGFVDKLRDALDDLRVAYPTLLEQLKADFISTFDRPGDLAKARIAIADTASKMLVMVADSRLKAFCFRLADQALGDDAWIEALGSFVCSKPPSKWLDADATAFRDELGRLAQQFRRVETTLFQTAGHGSAQSAMRVALTSRDGQEVEKVVYVDASEEAVVAQLEATFSKLLKTERRLGVAAAMRAIWKQLQKDG